MITVCNTEVELTTAVIIRMTGFNEIFEQIH